MRAEEDEYFDKVQALNARLSGDGPDESIRRIAREEADKRVAALIKPVIFVGAIIWANSKYGAAGTLVVIVLGLAWFLYGVLALDHSPTHDRHMVVNQAEDLNRLTILAQAQQAGEQPWVVLEKEYERDTRKVSVAESDRWDRSWQRVHAYALELERVSPKKRRKRLLDAA